jgi:hypothetical protein
MLRVLVCAVLTMMIAGAARGAVVADYGGNYTPNSFATNWSYLWNPSGVALTNGSGALNVGSLTPLVFNSTGNLFETAATGTAPLTSPGSYLSAGPTSVRVGDSSTQAADHNSHYVILAYTFTAQQIATDGNQLTFHTYNFNVPAVGGLDPLDVEIFKNSTLLPPTFQFPAGTVFSDAIYGQDYPFGAVNPGDTLYIALGGMGNYSGQNIGVSYTLALTPEPASFGLLLLGAPLLMKRRR